MVLVAAMTMALMAIAGVAAAATINGTSGNDVLTGTSGKDTIQGFAGDDRISGFAGGDVIVGGPGVDVLAGNRGNDKIDAVDGERDFITCGAGDDDVRADPIDSVALDCEDVRIVTDPDTPPGGEDGTDCSDNIDNDGDGKIDFPEDTGCSGPDDNTETPGNNPPGDGGVDCDDNLDNDGDGDVDFPEDQGCTSATDPLETGGGSNPQCNDGVDNDGDGKIDFGQDRGCASLEDNTENSDGNGGGDDGTICHKPDTPAEKTMTVNSSAMKGHLGHGDTLGPCDGDTSDNRANKAGKHKHKH
jgi:hypothetical protein